MLKNKSLAALTKAANFNLEKCPLIFFYIYLYIDRYIKHMTLTQYFTVN